MKEFTRTDNNSKFTHLNNQLRTRPGTIYTYSGVRLPLTCSPRTTRLGFCARRNSRGTYSYTAYIDRGIRYHGNNLLFDRWVQDGDWQFPSFEAMEYFFHSQLKRI